MDEFERLLESIKGDALAGIKDKILAKDSISGGFENQ